MTKPSYYDEAVQAAQDAVCGTHFDTPEEAVEKAIDAALPIIEAGVRADERRKVLAEVQDMGRLEAIGD